MALMEDNIRVIGTKAITKSGTIQGNITELYIGDDGKIEKCEITAPDGTTSDVTSDQISIFGKQVTVIDPNGEQEKKTKPVIQPAPAAPQEAPKEEPVEAPKAEEAPAEAPKAEEPAAEKPAEEPKAEAKPEPKKAEPAKEAPKAAPAKAADPKQAAADKATEERHRRFLLGKKAARTIKMDNGIVIVEAGADITEEVLQKAKLANKFIELSMNVQ
jgi:type IV secretory pathway VirB10-like protein